MSENRELLELAAKAAGLIVNRSRLEDPMHCDFLMKGNGVRNPGQNAFPWNPLSDDGDALRLAVKLGLTVCVSFKYDLTWADKDDKGQALAKSNHDGDPYAATRLAIVRAAAEIGRAKP